MTVSCAAPVVASAVLCGGGVSNSGDASMFFPDARCYCKNVGCRKAMIPHITGYCRACRAKIAGPLAQPKKTYSHRETKREK